jgi:hypothetical protein
MAVDPVCKMDVNEKEAKLVSGYKGGCQVNGCWDLRKKISIKP